MQGFTKCEDCNTMVQIDLADIEIRQSAFVLCERCMYTRFGIGKEGEDTKCNICGIMFDKNKSCKSNFEDTIMCDGCFMRKSNRDYIEKEDKEQ